jgi:hypothetical protein
MFVALMERFDLSYRVAGSPLGGESDEISLIAQMLPDIRPEPDLVREWPEQPPTGDEQQVQVCRIVDDKGHSATAEGLFYQLIVRLHRFSLGRENFDASVPRYRVSQGSRGYTHVCGRESTLVSLSWTAPLFGLAPVFPPCPEGAKNTSPGQRLGLRDEMNRKP